MEGPWTIERIGQRLWVALKGRFDVDDAQTLQQELRGSLGGQAPNSAELLIQLDGLTELSRDARYQLAELQRWIGTTRVRTAYVSDRPLFRGVALWLVHISDDFSARSFSSIEQAEQWFQIRSDRKEYVQTHALQTLKTLRHAPKASDRGHEP